MPKDIRPTKTKNKDNIIPESAAGPDRSDRLPYLSTDALYDWNIQKGEIYLSSKFFESFGYEIKDIPDIYNFWFSIIHSDDLIIIKKIIDEYNNGERDSHEYEYRVKTTSGEWRRIFCSGRLVKRNAEGRPERIIGLLIDLNTEQNITAQLSESEEKFYKAFHMSLDPFTIATFSDGRFIEVNDAFLKMHNLKKEEVLNKTAVELGIWDPSRPRDLIINSVIEKGSCKDVELEMRGKNGNKIYGLFSCSIIDLSTGPKLFSVFRDLSLHKRTVDLLRIQKDLSYTLASATELYEIGKEVLDSIIKIEGIDSGGFYVIDSETGNVNLIAHRGLSESFIESVSFFNADSLDAQIASKGEILFFSGPNMMSRENNLFNKEGLKLVIAIPIMHENKAIAHLNLASHTHDALPQEIRDGLEAITKMLGSAIARILSEIAIREINARLKAIIDSPQNISIFSIDTNFCYTSFNERHKKEILDIYKNEIKIGTNSLDVISDPKFKKDAKRNFERAFNGETVIKKHEIDGTVYYISVSPIVGEKQKITGVSCFMQDITKQELSEKALIESEKKFSTIIETAAEGILIADIPDKKFIYSNPTICSMLGYSAEEFMGMTVNDIHPEDNLPVVISYFKACAAGKIKMAAAVPLLRKDGTIFYANISASPIIIKGNDCLVGFFTDITERKMAVDLLTIQKDLSVALSGTTELKELGDIVLRAATRLDRIDAGSFHIRNMDTGELSLISHLGHHGEFIKNISFFAPDFSLSKLVAQGEPVIKSYLDYNYPEDDFRIREGVKFSYIIPIKHENNVVAVLIIASFTHYELTDMVRASISAIAGIVGGSVSRILSESATRDLNAQIKSIIDSPRDIIIFSLDSNYCFSSFNQAFKKWIHEILNIELMDGVNILELFITPELRTQGKKDFDRALNGESFSRVVKLREILFEFRISPIFDDKKRIRGISCFGRDITEQKNMEEKLRQSEKMEAIGQLAGGIAHDFNNELSIISGYAELLRDEVEAGSEMKSYIDGILNGVKRSANLIYQMLAFSRKGKYLLTTVNMHEIISEIVIMLKHSIDKRIIILQDLKADTPTTQGDPSQLKSAILNLALNARDAMPDGGELLFTTDITEITDESYKNAPYYIDLGKYIRISVSDTGIGMDKKTQNRLFEPFFTTKGKGKGTGFGLASVYGTVKNHNGMINVYSEPGHGSIFKIYLPACGKSQTRSKTKPGIAKFAKISAGILLADDEKDLCVVGKKILNNLGYKVNVCHNGKEAVRFYKKNWKKIDLVILDMIMPVMNGRDAFIAMKKINPGVKALLTSGYSLDGEAQAIIDKGVMGFLQKPFKKDELSGKIIRILKSTDKIKLPAKKKRKKTSKLQT